MDLPPWFLEFCDLRADRRLVLARHLRALGLDFDVLATGPHRHLQVRRGRTLSPAAGETVLVAHYDRVAGSPGANDNGASVWALVDYLVRTPEPLRVVFTDGEERAAEAGPEAQGAWALARSWGGIPVTPVVFDMTGIGDTFVLGHLAAELWQRARGGTAPADLGPAERVRLAARRWLAASGEVVEANTPFSDDLGFLAAGVPAVQVSLLPARQARAYRTERRRPGELGGEAHPGPPAWATMHSPLDGPGALEAGARRLLAQALDRLTGFPGFNRR